MKYILIAFLISAFAIGGIYYSQEYQSPNDTVLTPIQSIQGSSFDTPVTRNSIQGELLTTKKEPKDVKDIAENIVIEKKTVSIDNTAIEKKIVSNDPENKKITKNTVTEKNTVLIVRTGTDKIAIENKIVSIDNTTTENNTATENNSALIDNIAMENNNTSDSSKIVKINPVDNKTESATTGNKTVEKLIEKKKMAKKKNSQNQKTKKAGYEPMSFQFLSSYDISDDLTEEEAKKVPDYVRKLDGKIIGVAGYMVPTDMMSSDVSQFLLVNMNDNCCFGGTPKVTEFIFSEMNEGTTKYTNFPVAVIGKFSINKDFKEKVLYKLEVQKVIPSRDKIFWDIMKKAPTFPGTANFGSFSYGNN